MINESIIKSLKDILGDRNIKLNEPMKNHTSFKVGGPADILLAPDNTDNLLKILDICKSSEVPYFIMGNGTNLIVRDKGIRGVVVKIFDNFKNCSVNDELIEAEAGILLSRLANIALENELTGLEFASGIPGTLGGAIAMNAGAYGGEMKDVVISTEFIDQSGKITVIEGDQHQFGYRTSFIQKSGGIVLRTWLKLKKGNKEEIKGYMDDLKKRRKDKQPIEMPSAGSVFTRPEGYYTGKLVEDCGLRGYRIGDAQVSEKHCGFIVNAGEASACDILQLIGKIQKDVRNKFGVDLNTEVRIVGEE